MEKYYRKRGMSKKVKSTDIQETKKDRDKFREGWDRIWGDKEQEKKNGT